MVFFVLQFHDLTQPETARTLFKGFIAGAREITFKKSLADAISLFIEIFLETDFDYLYLLTISGVFIVNFEHILHLVLVFLLLILIILLSDSYVDRIPKASTK